MSDSSSKPFEPFKAPEGFVPSLAYSTAPGAYALLHEAGKVAWVGKGQSWIESLSRNLRHLQVGEHACQILQESWNAENWTLCRAEMADPMVAYRLMYQWCKDQGYQVLSQAPVSWAPVLEVIEDPRPDAGRVGRFPTYLAAVWNKSSSGRKILGKVFETVDEARVWSEAQFPGGKAWEPQVGDDELTRRVEELL